MHHALEDPSEEVGRHPPVGAVTLECHLDLLEDRGGEPLPSLGVERPVAALERMRLKEPTVQVRNPSEMPGNGGALAWRAIEGPEEERSEEMATGVAACRKARIEA